MTTRKQRLNQFTLSIVIANFFLSQPMVLAAGSLADNEFSYGLYSYQHKQYDQAGQYFWKAIVDGNPKAAAWLYMGHSQLNSGQQTGAIQTYAAVVRIFPSTPEATQANALLLKFGTTVVRAAMAQPDVKPAGKIIDALNQKQEAAAASSAASTSTASSSASSSSSSSSSASDDDEEDQKPRIAATSNAPVKDPSRLAVPSKQPSSSPAASADPSAAMAAASTSGRSLKDKMDIIPPRFGHPAVTPATISLIKQAIDKMPPRIDRYLADNNVVLHLVPNLTDKWPEALKETRSDGSNLSTDIGRTYGRDMYVCQQIIEPSTNAVRETIKAADIEATFYNECGHALDDILKFSNGQDVKEAYDQDVPNIPEADKQRFWLFLQDGQSGKSETCAEIIAALLGGKGYNTQLMKASFPRTYAVVKKRTKL